MEIETRSVELYEGAQILLLGSYAIAAALTIAYFVLQSRFLRYVQRECPAAYEQLDRPDVLLGSSERSGLIFLYVLPKRFDAIDNPHAVRLGSRLRELCLSLFVVSEYFFVLIAF